MTVVNAGGVQINKIAFKKRFKKDSDKIRKADPRMGGLIDQKIRDLVKNPRPAGLAFEKLKGYKRPDIYTVHVTGNYKISFEVVGDVATLRRIGCHDEIDLSP